VVGCEKASWEACFVRMQMAQNAYAAARLHRGHF